ncbi:hypothetical protein [Commensalibacter papalotli (ex Servin-Garciduenas et al. 2014)]|uniref:Uncharacterized protein n=1 Tax=Commensalibacter papalotli (ex Servin-Garciduenas et al. 2014) TaxID=1208583 RepID=W7E6W5_9PROT|nr:hypothetical protein [Commensalibacter papalotli (ex Servin-Garciduenas et al. 2014)]EUK18886.1 hypothetical protein COMX_04030 [Commensalibacter papalotli (ex Servin-Garciduenas et al. 2014)]
MTYQFIAGKPVTTTNFKSVQPLGVGGQLVLEQWEALYQILKYEISPQCAGLLLEPVIDRQRGEVDWYIPSDLQSAKTSPVSRQDLLQKADRFIAQARQLAKKMANSSDMVQRQKGALLEQALSYPSKDYIIETPYGPALIAWGHQSSESDVQHVAVVAAKGDQQGIKSTLILPPPILLIKQQGLLSYWPWLMGLLLLILMIILPWWEGIIPVQYCRYYWLAPLILLLILLPLIGLFVRNYFLSAKRK